MTNRVIIPAPTLGCDDQGRFEECQKAIEDGLLELLGAASDAGWRNSEIIAAMIAVAENTQLAQDRVVGPSIEIYLKKIMKKRD